MVAAAILLAEWQVRDTPNIPIPYLYPSICATDSAPRWTMTGAPMPWGWPPTSPRSGRTPTRSNWRETSPRPFRADLSDGVIQQSLLHFSPEEVNHGLAQDRAVYRHGGDAAVAHTTGPRRGSSFCTAKYIVPHSAASISTAWERSTSELNIEHHTQTAGSLQKAIEIVHRCCALSRPQTAGWRTDATRLRHSFLSPRKTLAYGRIAAAILRTCGAACCHS